MKLQYRILAVLAEPMVINGTSHVLAASIAAMVGTGVLAVVVVGGAVVGKAVDEPGPQSVPP